MKSNHFRRNGKPIGNTPNDLAAAKAAFQRQPQPTTTGFETRTKVGANPRATQDSDLQSTPEVDWFRVGVTAYRFALIATVLFLLLINVTPYIGFIQTLSTKAFTGFGWVLDVPLIGGFILRTYKAIQATLGILMWFVVQTCEIVPLLLTISPGILLQLIVTLKKFPQFQIEPSDSAAVRVLKERFNNTHADHIQKIQMTGAIAYFVDLVANVAFYPPLKGDPFLWLRAPSMADVDSSNLFTIGTNLFIAEVAIFLWIVFSPWKGAFFQPKHQK